MEKKLYQSFVIETESALGGSKTLINIFHFDKTRIT